MLYVCVFYPLTFLLHIYYMGILFLSLGVDGVSWLSFFDGGMLCDLWVYPIENRQNDRYECFLDRSLPL